MILKVRLKEILDERNLKQVDLIKMTGLRPNTISDMVKNNRDSINRYHIGAVAKALEVDVQELLYFEKQ